MVVLEKMRISNYKIGHVYDRRKIPNGPSRYLLALKFYMGLE